MTAFMGVLRQRGVAFLDDGSMSRRPGAWARASANRIIDEQQTPAAIVGQLNALEALAKAPRRGAGHRLQLSGHRRGRRPLDRRPRRARPAAGPGQRDDAAAGTVRAEGRGTRH